jgi:hypothetical protein
MWVSLETTALVTDKKREGKKPVGRQGSREDNIKMCVSEIGWKGVDRIHVAQDWEKWRGCCERGDRPWGPQMCLHHGVSNPVVALEF